MGNALVVQGLRLCVSTAGGTGSIPGPGTKILHARWYSQKKKKMGKVRKELIEGSLNIMRRCFNYTGINKKEL